MITRKKNDWMLWKDLSEDKRDDPEMQAFNYDRTVRTIKGALKLQCKFNKERIILCQ